MKEHKARAVRCALCSQRNWMFDLIPPFELSGTTVKFVIVKGLWLCPRCLEHKKRRRKP